MTLARDIAIIETLYGSGIRVNELVNLNVPDIDFEKKIVTVYKGKNRKDRAVPINTTALSYLREYIEEQRPKLLGNHLEKTALFLTEVLPGLPHVPKVRAAASLRSRT